MESKIITFTLRKGGVGKTTLATNQAVLLAKAGKKVLIIDIDPQCNAALQFGISNLNSKLNSIATLVEKGIKSFDNIIIKSNELGVDNLDILPSNVDLQAFFDRKDFDAYKAILKTIIDIKKLNHYDYIIIDTNPSWNQLIEYLIQVSSKVVVPFSTERNSILAIQDFIVNIVSFLKETKAMTEVILVPNGVRISYRKGVVVKDRSYLFLNEIKELIKDGGVTLSSCISKSEQYANAIAFDNKPLCLLKETKANMKYIGEQKELNNLLLK